MRNISKQKLLRKKNILCSVTFLENYAIYEKMLKNIVDHGHFVAGSVWIHPLDTNILLTLDYLQTIL